MVAAPPLWTRVDVTRLQGPLLILVWSLAVGFVMWVSGVDVAVQFWLEENYHQPFNDVMRVMGEVGKGSYQIGACLLAALVWAFFVWWERGSYARLKVFLLVVPVFLLAGSLNWLVKLAVGRPRPKELLWNGTGAFDVQPFTLDAAWWSLPSGHSCSTFAIGVWLGLMFPRWRYLIWSAAVVLSLSRFLALTPHYMGDVVAGAGLGTAVAWTVWLVLEYRRALRRKG